MRWYGPDDPVSLLDIKQAGCNGVVTALHQIPVGDIWPLEAIGERKSLIESFGLKWTVVESLPVHEDIKKNTGEKDLYIQNYKECLTNLAKAGIEVVTYNFMPILDWVRTNPFFIRPDQTKTLRFVKTDFVLFDIFLLERPNARSSYEDTIIEEAERLFEHYSEAEKNQLFNNVMLGLPGSKDAFTKDFVLESLKQYEAIDEKVFKANLIDFLKNVVPIAEDVNIKLAIHPDDPPFSLLGLPRVVSTEKDLSDIIEGVPSPNNGFCFCTGSLGAHPQNDIVSMIKKFENNIHFLHLRNTKRDPNGDFEEAPHLEGDTNMKEVMQTILSMMQKRKLNIPMRPDHGFQMLDDLQKDTYPGYSAIGRLKGLAELRGLELGVMN